MKSTILRAGLGAAVCACCSVGSAWAAPIAHVSVSVSSVQEKMPPLVQKRIAASIQTVGNHVLLTHDSGEVLANGEEYNRIINDIVNRVLIGYTVESIQIQPGEDTTLAVQIRPWGETIQSVAMHVDYGALPDMGRRLADGDLRNASSIVENLLIGLPVDALDWADGTIKAVMESELESQLPEFYPHIAITPGRRAEVEIYLLPKLPVVRNVDVAIEAEHLPRVIFLSARKNIEERYAGLEGLPVAFVHRHERDIQADLRRSVDSQWVIRKYKLKVDPVVEIGENMKIQLRSHTDFYDIQAGAYVDVGRDDNSGDDTVLKAHLGRKIGGHHEVYTQVEFMPSSVDWNIIPGYFYRWGKYTRLGYQYETDDDSSHVWVRQYLGKKWMLRFDRDLTNHEDEIGLTYRVHEYIGLEYIVSDHDNWLRVIGYL